MSAAPTKPEVLTRRIRLGATGETVIISIDLSADALARFATVASQNKTKQANYCAGVFRAQVQP